MNIGIGSVSNIRISVSPVHVLTAQLQWALSLASVSMVAWVPQVTWDI